MKHLVNKELNINIKKHGEFEIINQTQNNENT